MSQKIISDNQYYQAHLDADLIKHIIHRNSDLKNEVLVIKLAANIIEDDSLLLNFADNIKVITDSGAGVIIVHDYTNLVSSTLQLFDISQQTIGDLPLTDHKTSQIIEMVLSGYINKKIVSFLSNANCKAVGISGKDGNLIESRRSFVAQQSHDDLINIGFIGEPIEINHQILASFLNAELVTVISPVSSGLNRATHILDPDVTASCIASELMAKHLIFLTPLGNISVDGNDLSKCSLQKLRALHQQNLINSNYSKIIQAARKALERNTKFAYISNANIEDATMLTIFANQRSTKIFL